MNKLNIPILSSVSAILPEALRKMEYEYLAYRDGTPEYRAYIEAKGPFEVDVNKAEHTFFVDDDIAVIRIEGVIMPKGDFFSELFGGLAALDVLMRDFKLLLASDEINAIVLDIDSPGGSVTGMFAFADMVFEARAVKPIFTFSDSVMASAAMLIGAAAGKGNTFISDEAVMTGAVAAIMWHTDISGLEEKLGIKTTTISDGKNKIIDDIQKPLSKEGREELEARVKHIDNAQMEAIARYRETTVEAVRAYTDRGKVFLGSQAIDAGLIDGMMTSVEFMNAVKAELSANLKKI